MLPLPVYTDLQEKKKEGFAHLVQPMYAKDTNMGHPFRGRRGEEMRDLSPYQRYDADLAWVAKQNRYEREVAGRASACPGLPGERHRRGTKLGALPPLSLGAKPKGLRFLLLQPLPNS